MRPEAVRDVEAVEEGVGDPGGGAGRRDDEGVHHLVNGVVVVHFMGCVWLDGWGGVHHLEQ